MVNRKFQVDPPHGRAIDFDDCVNMLWSINVCMCLLHIHTHISNLVWLRWLCIGTYTTRERSISRNSAGEREQKDPGKQVEYIASGGTGEVTDKSMSYSWPEKEVFNVYERNQL